MSEIEQQDQTADDPKGLRAQLEAAREEMKALKADRRQRAYQDAGLPETAYDIFDSVYSGELTVEGLRSFAESKGFYLKDVGKAAPAEPSAEQQAGEARLQAVDSHKLPSEMPDLSTKLAEAQKAGDWEASFALKSARLNETNAPRRAAL